VQPGFSSNVHPLIQRAITEKDMQAPNFSLNGKIALLTGASRGIGEAIALAFALHGAHCILTSRRIEGLKEAAARIAALGCSVEIRACHSGNLQEIDDLVQDIEQRLGRIDILVNNAATNPYAGPFLGATEAAWDKTFDVNVKGVFFLTQKVVPFMPRGGSIINIASIEGERPGLDRAIYSMTKAAVISMTKAFSKELASRGIRANAILPGLVATQMSRSLMQDSAAYQDAVQLIPLRRPAQPEEISGTALYLASSASSFTTGAMIVVDGGVLA